jgi:GNAT superfamily N-acetyltransferase
MPAPPDQPGRGAWRAVTLCTGVAAAGATALVRVRLRRGGEQGRGFPGRERLVTFQEGARAAAPGARGGPLPVVRDADPGDTGPVLAVYSACIAADPGYLPFLAPGDEPSVLAWFRLKPLLACLVADLDGTVAGVAGLRDAEPGPGAGQPGGRWLEACRLAVHPAYRGGAVTRDLVSARASRAVALGVDRLWMRCVENSPSHRLALSHGWTWWAQTEFEGPAALQQAVLLARPLRERQARRSGT